MNTTQPPRPGFGSTTRRRAALALCLAVPSLAGAQALILTEDWRTTLVEGSAALALTMLDRGIVAEVRYPTIGTDPGDLSIYQCVWDLRIDDIPSPIEQSRFEEYAMAGGSLFFAGEHSAFDSRNLAVGGILLSLGGGGVLTDPTGPPVSVPADFDETVNATHPIATQCDAVSTVVYDGVDNGRFLDVGFGTPLTMELPSMDIGAAVWGPGQLFAAPNARAVFALDVNFLAPFPDGTLDLRNDGLTPTENAVFVNNLITYLCGLDCCSSARRPSPAMRLAAAPPAPPSSAESPCSPSSASAFPFGKGKDLDSWLQDSRTRIRGTTSNQRAVPTSGRNDAKQAPVP